MDDPVMSMVLKFMGVVMLMALVVLLITQVMPSLFKNVSAKEEKAKVLRGEVTIDTETESVIVPVQQKDGNVVNINIKVDNIENIDNMFINDLVDKVDMEINNVENVENFNVNSVMD